MTVTRPLDGVIDGALEGFDRPGLALPAAAAVLAADSGTGGGGSAAGSDLARATVAGTAVVFHGPVGLGQ